MLITMNATPTHPSSVSCLAAAHRMPARGYVRARESADLRRRHDRFNRQSVVALWRVPDRHFGDARSGAANAQ
jgi:hypothetical protein